MLGRFARNLICFALMVALVITISSPVLATGDEPESPDNPVLLIHGFADASWTPWWDVLEGYLKNDGYSDDQIHVMKLGQLLTTIDSPEEYAKEVCQKLASISSDHDGNKVDIISHSMGGLDARWCIEKRGGDFFVDDLVTVATPHQGTLVAYLGALTPGGRDMIPGSDFLTTLNSGALAEGVEYTAVWGSLDEAVVPNENAELPPHMTWSTESRSFKAGPYTHLAMVALKDVYDQYYPYLED